MIFIFSLNIILFIATLIWLTRAPLNTNQFIIKYLGILEISWTGFLIILALLQFLVIMESMNEGSILRLSENSTLKNLYIISVSAIIHLSIFIFIALKYFNLKKLKSNQ